ncbi:hypothetical protein SE17_04110 [Kouleothrix aurantiaca]|uniref:Uncharacterized protein n=1 Tax=Kouleothrix aurantiaca TaxID=186479 RepID=A0A0P9DWC4_9CHLR|nr:hypothetical protein SE17_04110 [Kouleothrix aurantiaca]
MHVHIQVILVVRLMSLLKRSKRGFMAFLVEKTCLRDQMEQCDILLYVRVHASKLFPTNSTFMELGQKRCASLVTQYL